MKPSMIYDILDLALETRKKNENFIPLFSGDAGIGKSEICQQWVKNKGKDFGFIDLRPAYCEGPDFIGLPFVLKDENNVERSIFALPKIWPTKGEGLLLIEEPNRANQSVMNALMQILTDRTINDYKIPEGWIIASCINQDNAYYNVNSMDTAFVNRFVTYDVKYDFETFVKYIEDKEWHTSLVSFIKSGQFVYIPPEEIGDKGKYISPRTLSKLNIFQKSSLAKNLDIHYETSISILGESVGKQYYKYVFEVKPITAKDILEDKKMSYKKLEEYSDRNKRRGDLLDVTVESLIKEFGKSIDENVIIEVSQIIPADQAVNLLGTLICEEKLPQISELIKKHPKLKEYLKIALKRKENRDENS